MPLANPAIFTSVHVADVTVSKTTFIRIFAFLQGTRNFTRDQRLHLESRGWRVLVYEGNAFAEDELDVGCLLLFWLPLLSGRGCISSLVLSSRSEDLSIGFFWGSGDTKVSTVWPLVWSTVTMATVRSPVWVWVNWMTGLTDGGSHFRMRIILGTILIWFLVYHVAVPECSRNGSGVRPYLWVQEKFV